MQQKQISGDDDGVHIVPYMLLCLPQTNSNTSPLSECLLMVWSGYWSIDRSWNKNIDMSVFPCAHEIRHPNGEHMIYQCSLIRAIKQSHAVFKSLRSRVNVDMSVFLR